MSQLLAGITVFVFVALLTRVVEGWLTRKGIIDHPGGRSSHVQPTPRGGGLVIAPIVLVAWAIFVGVQDWILMAGSAALALVSWIDDHRGLSAAFRLATHFIVVTVVVLATQPWAMTGILGIVLAAATILAWVWFINLYNFMDGIDGISGIETISICAGFLIIRMIGASVADISVAVLLVGAAAGFLTRNWPPAKIFLGDIGSVFLGFVIGVLLLSLATDGHWAAAVILPAYYLFDSGFTLAKRAIRGERVWVAHKSHFYQIAHQRGLSHARVSGTIMVANTGLIVLAVWAENGFPVLATVSAYGLVAFVSLYFTKAEVKGIEA